MTTKNAISPTREENYPDWYQEVIKAADLAENSPVRGCMTIKPWGYAIWELIQQTLDQKFKQLGHMNAYFPLLIPLSYLEQEAKHIEGFAKECAVVTHHRLEVDGDKLVPAGPLEAPLVIRPTSEAIIGVHFAKWIESHRDLPLKINQWANIMRWEMRTRMFLRTSEFLWQEGHTAHATQEEAIQETLTMLDVYEEFAKDTLAMPVIKGEKTANERFPGAVHTYAIEGMMQDGKALQAGTSHFLGQNFSKSFDISYSGSDGQLSHVYTTSWGVSTRLIGGLIMTHSDDDGLVLPPRIAPSHVVIIPLIHKEQDRSSILEYCEKLGKKLHDLIYHRHPLRVAVDTREIRGGEKNWQYIKQGVPIRLEIGAKEVANHTVFMGRRDRPHKDKQAMDLSLFVKSVHTILDDIQNTCLARAQTYQNDRSAEIDTLDDFKAFFDEKNKNSLMRSGGFAYCDSSDSEAVYDFIKDHKVTARCQPLGAEPKTGKCVFTGKPAKMRVIFARAY